MAPKGLMPSAGNASLHERAHQLQAAGQDSPGWPCKPMAMTRLARPGLAMQA